MSNQVDKKQLLQSKEFETALIEGAEAKKEVATTCKNANKAAFEQFNEIMFTANKSVQQILGKRRKDRTDVEVEEVKRFKQTVRQMYFQAQHLLAEEVLEEGQKSKIDKIVDKLIPILYILRYIEANALEDALAKYGIKLDGMQKLDVLYPDLAEQTKRDAVKTIFSDAKSIKDKINKENESIGTSIYMQKVPVDLQYDKSANNTGLKPGDFRKLVDMKFKLDMAKSKEQKDKVDEKIQDQAAEKQFEIARAELVRDGLTILQ